mmetsp:Transcript_55351/g.172090  ORF Transcript_55351/g.172090 Transcript_55351/m.172090 type:complete len:431 (+) Transcript_55351:1-1293(+)
MEYCAGGDLLGRMKRAGRLPEEQASKVMAQIFRAVYYLHGIRICHRDLKPENCLLTAVDSSSLSGTSCLRVADFGLSCCFAPGQTLKTCVGTVAFMAPQVLAKAYDQACDLWSCGVITYMLLCGYLPFASKTRAETRKMVQEGQISYVAADWAHVSEHAMDLVTKLLRKDAKNRCDAKQALSHAWIKEAVSAKVQVTTAEAKIVQGLQGFRSLNRFKRAALQVIASLLAEDQIRASREAFITLDADADGLISLSDLQGRLRTAELEEAARGGNGRAQSLLQFLDGAAGPWKACTYTEFLAATFDRSTYCTRPVCIAAFNVFDTNKNGLISKQELGTGTILGDLSKEELAHLFRDLDHNGDGEIDFEEFVDMMRDGEGWVQTLPKKPKPRKPPKADGNQVQSADFGTRPPESRPRRVLPRTKSWPRHQYNP